MVLRHPSPAARPARRAAFTLLEVLIVVAIIVILAGVGGLYLMRAYEDARKDIARTKAQNLAKAAQQYELRMGQLPENLNLLLQPADGSKPFIEPDLLVDPWGQQFQYDPSGPNNGGLKPDVWTTCPTDGQVLGNWK